jgi:transposase-like protein
MKTEKFYCRGNPKFSDDDKLEMFNLYESSSLKLKEIAEKFECSTTIVHRYIDNERYKRRINK